MDVNQTTWLRIGGFCVDGEAASNSTLQSFLMGTLAVYVIVCTPLKAIPEITSSCALFSSVCHLQLDAVTNISQTV